MPHYRVGLICNDTKVLSELANRLKEPWSTITEEEGMYYWSSSYFEALVTAAEVDEHASRLLPRLNGLVKLHLVNASELTKAGRIKFIDDQGQQRMHIHLTSSLTLVYNICENIDLELEVKRRWLNIAERSLEKEEDSPVNYALSHFGKEANWDNLYQVYEVIRADYYHSRGITSRRGVIPLPNEWTRDKTGRNREQDFAETANNAYISGIAARHPIAESIPVVQALNSSLLKVGSKEILPMTLNEAKIFITGLLTQWLTNKLIATNDPK